MNSATTAVDGFREALACALFPLPFALCVGVTGHRHRGTFFEMRITRWIARSQLARLFPVVVRITDEDGGRNVAFSFYRRTRHGVIAPGRSTPS